MTDIVERLRRPDILLYQYAASVSDDGALLHEAADEIERLRGTIRQADYVFELLSPESHSQTTDSELASLLSSVGEKLSEMVATWDNAALGEGK